MPLHVTPLGGLGEIGMNCMLISRGADSLVVDCGVRFPGPDAHGVDLVLPDLKPLRAHRASLRALLLTHGHEDHIGAVPRLLELFPELPVYGSPFTLALVRQRLEELEVSADLRELRPRRPVELGGFTVEPLRVAHSIPDGFALAISSPEGLLVHTGDFKIDEAPVDGQQTDLARFAELGDQGVLCLLSDSTNAMVAGRCPGERTVAPGIAAALRATSGRVVVAMFGSHIHRVQQVLELAHEHGRRAVLNGRSLEQNVRSAEALGLLKPPPGVLIAQEAAADLPARQLLILSTGAQGEPRSGLARLAFGTHPRLHLEAGDGVIFSSRAIPGNELAIAALHNALARIDVEIFAEPEHPVHVSGHAFADDQQQILRLTRPRCFIPIHGEARHLRAHQKIALANGLTPERCMLAYDGDVIDLHPDGPMRINWLELRKVFVDRWGGEAVAEELVRDRGVLAESGLIVVLIILDHATGALAREPELLSRGVSAPEPAAFWKEAQRRVVEELAAMTPAMRADVPAIEDAVTAVLRRHCKKQLEKRPLVLPVVVGL